MSSCMMITYNPCHYRFIHINSSDGIIQSPFITYFQDSDFNEFILELLPTSIRLMLPDVVYAYNQLFINPNQFDWRLVSFRFSLFLLHIYIYWFVLIFWKFSAPAKYVRVWLQNLAIPWHIHTHTHTYDERLQYYRLSRMDTSMMITRFIVWLYCDWLR